MQDGLESLAPIFRIQRHQCCSFSKICFAAAIAARRSPSKVASYAALAWALVLRGSTWDFPLIRTHSVSYINKSNKHDSISHQHLHLAFVLFPFDFFFSNATIDHSAASLHYCLVCLVSIYQPLLVCCSTTLVLDITYCY